MSICTVTRTWSDGIVDSYEVEWPGRSAAVACAHYLERDRTEFALYTRDDATTLTAHHPHREPARVHMAWRDIKEES